jgi:cytochrome c oxidase subunit 3/cytochrome o ubiquinol oxidase subunit 3
MTSVVQPVPEVAAWDLPSRLRAGVVGLIVAEASLFAVFVVAYLFYIGKSLSGPSPREVLDAPIFTSVCLWASSGTVWLATRALHRWQLRGAGGWLLLTVALGGVFLGGTALEWRRLIVEHGLTIGSNLFGTSFYSLVGLHAFHVTVGLAVLTLLLVFAWTGWLRPTHGEHVEMVSWYWHFVDVVWVLVFSLVYLVGR